MKDTIIIKRYQNRKLYDTSDSCYVTLEDIGEMIRIGKEIKVIDNKSGEDLTAVTLAQIIFEAQKRKTSVLPESLLTHMIRLGGGALRDILAKALENGVREMGTVREFVDEKIKPTMEAARHLPSLQSELEEMRQKITALEKKLLSQKK
ncbi:MAG: hypothetical protein A3I05_01555 [Deltaproteobacteria bacterium RIFCSPLOWO2_02_FULL_44_10]|nr:MAG: hypothetical protein A3C46_05150 [Deltaproteobacteria bacterium RIFCSPHIGHO2_02_FULL_44_16]OGQ45337.1 MAG: hypothetical protein A3I05_01555 [Deltaproteobacteria bacterium RIFCSPLOWO2_02_FULL_44_10]